jgi:penicillin amidase
MINVDQLKAAIPPLTGTLDVPGLESAVEVYRDRYGIPHIKASNERDAFFSQGFVTAQDRLWHMEYDRRRGMGRWAEVVGASALEQDKLTRRFRLEASARSDYEAVAERTRSMFDAYACGVNAFIEHGKALPVEYEIAGISPEPWQPWDGLVAYKVRHILMGVFESKIWRAQVLKEVGPEKTAELFPGYQPGQLLILPPGKDYEGPLADDSVEELSNGIAALGYLNGSNGGSNSWALAGAKTATGMPLVAGDSHRALDTPNVYYQNHLSCPSFDVVGLSFPGVPGFPHFGHNDWVSWCVTHLGADYQDLYIERFKEDDPRYYLFEGQWRRAESFPEVIKVRGGDDVNLDVAVTHHGPVISGGPESGSGLAFKYTATEGASAWPDTLWQMLLAKDANELVESMREWMDPCNNFVFGDVHGNAGYLCRGKVPVRSSANGWLPVPGWTGEHEWQGYIPFDEMPRSVNPEQQYIATANNKPVDDDYPHYISVEFTPGFRARRVTKGLLALDHPDASAMAKVHAERISIPALAYLSMIDQVEPQDALSASAKERLLSWSGHMDADRVEPTIYSAFRDALLKEVLHHNLGHKLGELAWSPDGRGLGGFIARLKSRLSAMVEEGDHSLLPTGKSWPDVVSDALAKGVADLKERLGDNMDEWRWDRLHQARPRHTLSEGFPELAQLLDPPPIPMSGDGDTPLAGSYAAANPATVTGLSVARYVYDMSDWNNSLWTVPLGSSGHPGSHHYHDQSETWRKVELVPMEYDWEHIVAHSETQQRLEPA